MIDAGKAGESPLIFIVFMEKLGEGDDALRFVFVVVDIAVVVVAATAADDDVVKLTDNGRFICGLNLYVDIKLNC
jgi:hypothetical protein